MKNLLIVALLAFSANVANAFVVENSAECSAQGEKHLEEYNYTVTDEVDQTLGEYAAAIDSIEDQPVRMLAGTTAGTLVRVGETANDLAQDIAEPVQKIVEYAIQDTPACLNDAEHLGSGVNCFIQTPNKIITVSGVAGANIGETLSVGVYSVTDGLLQSAIEEPANAIAEALQDAGEGVDPLDVVAVPFVVVGWAASGARAAAEIVFVDTIGGGFGLVGGAIAGLGSNLCDMARSLLVEGNPFKMIGHGLGAAVDLAAEGVNLGSHLLANVLRIVTFGQADPRDEMDLKAKAEKARKKKEAEQRQN